MEQSGPASVAENGGEFGGGDRAHVGANFALDLAVGIDALEDDAGVVVGGMQGESNGEPEWTPMPDTAICSRSVVCLAPFIELVEPVFRRPLQAAPSHPQAPRGGHISAVTSATVQLCGRHPPRDQKVP